MKNLFTIFVILNLFLPAYTETITGGIRYSMEDARLELQNNKPKSIDFILTNDNYTDNNFTQNQTALLKGQTKLNDRTLAKFSDSTYGVIYKNDPAHVYYYDSEGNLIYTEIKTGLNYPYSTYKYTPEGDLVNMTMRVSENETFIFDKLGKLLGHWINQNCYDESGKIIMTREIYR